MCAHTYLPENYYPLGRKKFVALNNHHLQKVKLAIFIPFPWGQLMEYYSFPLAVSCFCFSCFLWLCIDICAFEGAVSSSSLFQIDWWGKSFTWSWLQGCQLGGVQHLWFLGGHSGTVSVHVLADVIFGFSAAPAVEDLWVAVAAGAVIILRGEGCWGPLSFYVFS